MRPFLERATSWLDDRLNPIVVKELRQAVQGRFVSAILNILLAIQLTALTIYLLTDGVKAIDLTSTQGEGREVFGIIFAILLFITIIILPLYVGGRLYFERASEALSLLFISTLPPRRIIAGKLFASQVLAILLFIACLPFVSFTYFLRGIDLPSILVIFAFGFIVVSLCLQAGILVACLPGGRFLKILLGLGCLIALPIVYGVMVEICDDLLTGGVGSRLLSGENWGITGTFLGISAATFALLFLISVALVSPTMANRAPPVRLFLTGAFILSTIGVLSEALLTRSTDLLDVWLGIWTAIFTASFLVATSTRDRLSARVARQVPRSWLKRFFAFFFFSGSASGIAWSILHAGTMVGLGLLTLDQVSPARSDRDILESTVGFASYAFAYAMSALLLHRRFLVGRYPVRITWFLATILVVFGIVFPLLVAFVLSPTSFASTKDDWQWSFLDPFSAFDEDLREFSLHFGLLWSAFMAALSGPWFLRQAREFFRAGRPRAQRS